MYLQKKIIYFLIFGTILGLVLMGALLSLLPFFMQVDYKSPFGGGIVMSVLEYPGFIRSVISTLWVVFSTTLCVWVLSFCIMGYLYDSKIWVYIEKNISIFMSIPHLSVAIGFIFLLSPSGWIVRLLGFDRPLDFQTVNDAYNVSLITFLVVKELPFMIFMSIAPLSDLMVKRVYITSMSLGYSPIRTWVYAVYPYVYKKLLPSLLIVAIYAGSNIDVAQIVGGQLPPILSVMILEWTQHTNLKYQAYAGFGIVMLFFIFLALILLYKFIFYMHKIFYRRYKFENGFLRLSVKDSAIKYIAKISLLTVAVLTLSSALSNLIWSFAHRWRFPTLLPESYSTSLWLRNWDSVIQIMVTTIALSMLVTVVSLVIVITLLESMDALKVKHHKWATSIFITILLFPQLMVCFGLSYGYLYAGFSNYYINTTSVHCLYSMAYMYLILKPAFEKYKKQYSHVSLSLSRSRVGTFFSIKLNLMFGSIVMACAVGFTVSITQYVPTLFLGGGRINTLPLETISVFTGGDRRLMGMYSLVQTVIPLIIFYLFTYISNRKRGY